MRPCICQRHGGDLCAGGDAARRRSPDLLGTMCMAGTARLFNMIIQHYGIEIEYVDTANLDAVEAAIKPNTKLIHIETPTNPLMVLTDIAAVCEIAHADGVEVSVDNTFMSPALQSPMALGADIVMHSTTKFLNGHSDGLGGALIGIEAGAQGAFPAGAEGGGRNHVAI